MILYYNPSAICLHYIITYQLIDKYSLIILSILLLFRRISVQNVGAIELPSPGLSTTSAMMKLQTIDHDHWVLVVSKTYQSPLQSRRRWCCQYMDADSKTRMCDAGSDGSGPFWVRVSHTAGQTCTMMRQAVAREKRERERAKGEWRDQLGG